MRGHHNQYVIVAPDLKLALVQTAVGEENNEFPKNLYGIFTALMSEMEAKKILRPISDNVSRTVGYAHSNNLLRWTRCAGPLSR